MINLLPASVKENTQYAKRNNILLHFCLSTLGLLSLLVAIYAYQYLILHQDYKTSKAQYDTKSVSLTDNKTTIDAQKLSSTIATATTLLNKERKFSVFIKQVGSLMPAGAYLSTLNLTNDPKQPLQIEAVALTESQGLVIKKNIEEINDTNGKKIFNGADVQSITATKVKINNIEVPRYTIRITTAFAEKTTATSTDPSKAQAQKTLTSNDLIGEKKK